jgi:uncharacterized protein (TIGR03067 family)
MSQAISLPVFISYSSSDKAWAEKTVEALEEEGIRCWYAPRDINAGVEWGSAIIEGIDQCQVMIVVFSGHTNESSHVRREVERAISKGVPILPIRVDDCQPTGALDYALSNTQWLDAFQPPVDQRLNELIDAVRRLTSGRSISESAAAEKSATNFQPSRRRRFAIIVAVLLIAVAVPAVLTVLSRATDNSPDESAPKGLTNTSSGESTRQDSTVKGMMYAETLDASGAPFADKTLNFQGRWKVVREYIPTRGFYPKQATESRNNTWIFRGDTLTTVRRPTQNSRAGQTGTVSLRSTEAEHYFDFAGRDSEGRRQRWRGIYEMSAGRLRVCFRPRFLNIDKPPARPTTLSLRNQPDVAYLELVRQ